MTLRENAWLMPRFGWTPADYQERTRAIQPPPVPSGGTRPQSGTQAFLRAVGERPDWQADALCREPAYVSVNFFPDVGESTGAAMSVCRRCLVRDECRTAGIEGDEHGVWGATARRERVQLRAATVPTRKGAVPLERVAELIGKGRTREQIALEIGVTPRSVSRWIAAMRRAA